jgi:DNA-3-methyladenine glycosylase
VTKLTRDFYNRPTLEVAQALLGKVLVFDNYHAIITETEAYIGLDDPACHAHKGRTKRTEVMFGPAGYSYVYLIYGMYHCLNFITEEEGIAAGGLIRGAKLITEPYLNLNGPGKLCKFLQITKHHNCIDIVESDNFYVIDQNVTPIFKATPRIGIKKGIDKLWRFESIT